MKRLLAALGLGTGRKGTANLKARRGFRPALEAFEDRLVPTAVVISGDQGGVPTNDLVVVRPSTHATNLVEVLVNGQSQGEFGAEPTDLTIAGLDGNDTINVEATVPNVRLVIDAGAGKNLINVCSTGKFLDRLRGPGIALQNSSANAADTLNIVDTANTRADIYTVTSQSVQRAHASPITYDGSVVNLKLATGTAHSMFLIPSTSSRTAMTINTGTGGDQVNIGLARPPATSPLGATILGTLDHIQGPVTIQGGFVNAWDNGTAGGTNYVVSATSLARDGAAAIKFQPLSAASPKGAGLPGLATPVGLSLHATSGDDTIRVANNSAALFTIDGGTGTNTLLGPNLANIWTITSTNGGALNSKLRFAAIQNLVGGTSTDSFRFGTAGRIAGNIDGGGGANKIDFIDCNAAVVVNAWDGGSIPGRVGAMYGIGRFLFGYADSTLVAASSPNGNVWDLTDWNQDFKVSAAQPVFTAALAFIGPTAPSSYSVNFNVLGPLMHVVGGSTADVFQFSDLSQTGVASIDGGAGRNTLDLSRCTQNVYVNLATHEARRYTAPAANAYVSSTVRNVQDVLGGSRNDILVGDETDNYLDGGAGRNLLIGRHGADTLVGGNDQDILIGGTTSFDADAVSLAAINAYWSRADKSYADRTQYLNANYFQKRLNSHTPPIHVFNDLAANTIFGRNGQDWFWVEGPETNYNPNNPPPFQTELKDWMTGERIDVSGPSSLSSF